MQTVTCEVDGSKLLGVRESTHPDELNQCREQITRHLHQEGFALIRQLQDTVKKLGLQCDELHNVQLKLNLIKLQVDFVLHIFREIQQYNADLLKAKERGWVREPFPVVVEFRQMRNKHGYTLFSAMAEEVKLEQVSIQSVTYVDAECVSSHEQEKVRLGLS